MRMTLLSIVGPALLCGSLVAQIKVCATTANLGSLVRAVGGDDVQVVVLARAGQDPHFIDARPSFVKKLAKADLFVFVGCALEIGWAPLLVRQSRNLRIQPGTRGSFDASEQVRLLGVPKGKVDRSRGDVHAKGNPHFLTDPGSGLRVARSLATRLGEIAPDRKGAIEARYLAFKRQLLEKLFGAKLCERYDAEKLLKLSDHDRLLVFLRKQGELKDLAGWLGRSREVDIRAINDHDGFPYFTKRFGVAVHGFLEPKPGVPPSSKHLRKIVQAANQHKVGVILTVPYYDKRPAVFVAKHSGALVVHLAHQVGAIEGTADYLSFIDFNVNAMIAGLTE